MPRARDRDADRLALGRAAVLTVQRAVELIPVLTETERRDWLRERGLIRYLAGRPVVRWQDVLDALEDQAEQAAPPRPVATLPRVRL